MNSHSNTFRTLHDEFVLIGPVGERDKILARSDSAGMDLIGYAMDKDDSDEEKSATRLFDLFLGQSRSLHRVSSWPVQNAEPAEDERKSTYRFAWVGKCSSRDLVAIEKSFNANVFDISRAISDEDSEQLQLSLAPILLRCLRADDQLRRRQQLMRLFLAAYIMIFLAAAASMFIEPYLGRLL